MNAPTTWPDNVRTIGDVASVFDLLKHEGYLAPRDVWARLLRKAPELAEVAKSMRKPRWPHPTPMVSNEAWQQVCRSLSESVDGAVVQSSPSDNRCESGDRQSPTDSPSSTTDGLRQSPTDGDAALAAVTLERDQWATLALSLLALTVVAPDSEEDGDNLDDADIELFAQQSLYSRDELKWWHDEAQSRRIVTDEAAQRAALPARKEVKKHNLSMEEIVTRRMEAKQAKEATARAAIAATPSEPEPDYVDDGKPITADDDDGYGTPDYDEGDDSDETDSATPSWWARAAE